METSENIGAISLALSQAQADLTNVYKANAGYNYNYADLADVLEMVRATLPKYELAFVQTPSNDGANVSVTTMLCHSSGEWIKDTISVQVDQASKMSMAQSVGSIITYMRRYSISSIVGLTQTDSDASIRTDDDPDGDNASSVEVVRLASKIEIKGVKDLAEKAGVDMAKVLISAKVAKVSDMTAETAERMMKKLHAAYVKAESANDDQQQEVAS